MKYLWYHYKKITLISLTFLVLGFFGLCLWWLLKDPQPALARNTSYPNLQGWAWTETFGWISFNCATDGSCSSHDYGVYYDTDLNRFQGYAWSENFGWLDFTNGNSISFNSGDNKIYGSAIVVSLGDTDGEVKLNDNDTGDSIDFGLNFKNNYSFGSLLESDVNSYDDWGELRGWAWNGGDSVSKKGLGWVSVNCQNDSSCATADYKVVGRPDDISISVVRTLGNESTSLTVSWNSSILGVQDFRVWRRAVDNGEVSLTSLTNKNKTAVNHVDSNLDNYEEYHYLVMACNLFGCNLSNVAGAKTSPLFFDAGSDLKTSGVCIDPSTPNTSYVDLEWPVIRAGNGWSGNPDYYQAQYCVLEQGQTIDDCQEASWQNIVPVDASCLDYTGANPVACRDKLDNTRYNERYNLYAYRVRAIGDTGDPEDVSSWLKSSRLVRPCPRRTQPEYNETRPE